MNPDSDNSREKKTPPNRALKILRWFCREDYLEEIEGDLVEIFEMQSEESPKKAKRKFTWSVLKYFRPIFMKSFKSFYQPNFLPCFDIIFYWYSALPCAIKCHLSSTWLACPQVWPAPSLFTYGYRMNFLLINSIHMMRNYSR